MVESKYILDLMLNIIESSQHSDLLLNQLTQLKISKYEYTSSGLFVYFEFLKENSKNMFKLPVNESYYLDGLLVYSPFIPKSGAEVGLHFNEGIIDCLEIWCYEGDYPQHDLDEYTLTKQWTEKH